MQHVDCDTYIKMVPETQTDINTLRRKYPTLWPFDAVCVPKVINDKISLKAWSHNDN